MNARQRAKFKAMFGVEPDSTVYSSEWRNWHLRNTAYSAACQDEAEAVEGLLKALRHIESYAAGPLGIVAAQALHKWKGE